MLQLIKNSYFYAGSNYAKRQMLLASANENKCLSGDGASALKSPTHIGEQGNTGADKETVIASCESFNHAGSFGEEVALQSGCQLGPGKRLPHSNRVCPEDSLMIMPFVRNKNIPIVETNSEIKNNSNLFEFFTSIPCSYCESPVSLNVRTCSCCGRYLKGYWLWEKEVFKRLALLLCLSMSILLLPLTCLVFFN